MGKYDKFKYGERLYGISTPHENYELYKATLKSNYQTITKLEFLNPDDTMAFEIKSDFLQDGSINVNFQNGVRRTGNVVLENSYRQNAIDINKIWFGQRVRVSKGVILLDGNPYLLSQGVFYINNPQEAFEPNKKTINLDLVDKWAYLDGTLFGNLEGSFIANIDTNIYEHISKLLLLPRGNGEFLDNTPPLLSSYFVNKKVKIENEKERPWLKVPYTMRVDPDGKTYADVLLEFNTMLTGIIGYNNRGVLTIEPSEKDIKDSDKPVMWQYKLTEQEFLGATYSYKQSEMYNDVQVVGAIINGKQAKGRAENNDATSDTAISKIGRKTFRITDSKFYSDQQCQEWAEYKLKRLRVVPKSISFRSAPMFHFVENNLVEINRADKGGIVEKHLVTGFSLPIGQLGEMTVNATSINDI